MGLRDTIRNALLCVADRLSPPARLAADWEVVPLPVTGRTYIDRIARAGSHVWVLGSETTDGGQQRFACVDRGGGFERIADLPAGIGLDVWPLGETDLWLSGAGGAVAHYDGSTWTRHVWPGFYYDFLHVYATSGSDVWLKTAQRLVHFDGTAFTQVTAPEVAQDTWSVVWGVDDEVYVLLNRSTESGFAKRSPDGTWSQTMLGFGGATLIGGTRDDRWIMSSAKGGWHFDGTTWSRHATGEGRFWALHAEAGRAFIVGDKGALGTWDGDRWAIRSIGSDRLTAVGRAVDGRLLAGGGQLYRHSPK